MKHWARVGCLLWGFCGACEAEPSHVYVPALRAEELAIFGGLAENAVTHGGKVIAPPRGGALRTESERPLYAGPGPGEGREEPGRRSLLFRPDRVTELVGSVGYFEVFTPSVAPFKRVSALDAVVLDGDTPVLEVAQSASTNVAVVGLDAPLPDARPRDRFWGSVVLDFREGTHVPLPTVAADTRLLSVVTEPHAELVFERDGADNLLVIARGRAHERVRLTYLIDAPRAYFGGEVPDGPVDTLSAHVPAMPERVARDARAFARELGLSQRTGLRETLLKLVAHFRSFEESADPPRDTGNIFLDLARNRRGVCRHRAYAFVIVAQALGIPARFVQNEAHAWVEVELPGTGHMRVDLGGAAEGLDPISTDDRPPYRPEVPDPWPRPRAYQEAYARADAKRERDSRAKLARSEARTTAADANDRPQKSPRAQRVGRSPARDDRPPTTLRITRFAPEVMRGGALTVEGVATDANGAGIAELRIEVSLLRPEPALEAGAAEASGAGVLLGVGVSDPAGHFRLALAVPPEIAPRDYVLRVFTPGDVRHGFAQAE